MHSLSLESGSHLPEAAQDVQGYVEAILAEVRRLVINGSKSIAPVRRTRLFTGQVERRFDCLLSHGWLEVLLETQTPGNDNAISRLAELRIRFVSRRGQVIQLQNKNANRPFPAEYLELRVHLFASHESGRSWALEVMSRGRKGLTDRQWELVKHFGYDTFAETVGTTSSVSIVTRESLRDVLDHDAYVVANDVASSQQEVAEHIPVLALVSNALFQAGEMLTASHTTREKLQCVIQKHLAETTRIPKVG